MKKSTVKNEEKIIDKIIAQYGNVIDLKKTPHVAIEILRKFGGKISADDGNPCGGTPPTPGPGGKRTVKGDDLMKEILKISRAIKTLHEKFDSQSK